MSRASQPDKQNGTLSVHTIKASGHVHRTNRPNTRLHPTTTPNHQINPCNAGAIHTGHFPARLEANGAADDSAKLVDLQGGGLSVLDGITEAWQSWPVGCGLALITSSCVAFFAWRM
jgi:hypothetical protein